jgi:phage tail-like protein
MAGDTQNDPWPVPKFHFKATIGNKGEIAFQEVIGLDTEFDVIEYRAGNSVDFSTVEMPGLRKGSDITLKKGVFKSDSSLYDYFNSIKMNTISRQTVTIQLLDEANNPVMTWTLVNAFPVKVSATDLNAQNNEGAVEEIVFAHEGLSFEKA